jgi:hypothetical protein
VRGSDERTGALFGYVDLEARAPADHPLQVIRSLSAMAGAPSAVYSGLIRRNTAQRGTSTGSAGRRGTPPQGEEQLPSPAIGSVPRRGGVPRLFDRPASCAARGSSCAGSAAVAAPLGTALAPPTAAPALGQQLDSRPPLSQPSPASPNQPPVPPQPRTSSPSWRGRGYCSTGRGHRRRRSPTSSSSAARYCTRC